MRKVLMIVALVSVMAMPALAYRDDDQDDGPRYFRGTDSNGNPTTVKQSYPDQNVVVGNDGTPYKVVPGGVIDLNTGQFIPR